MRGLINRLLWVVLGNCVISATCALAQECTPPSGSLDGPHPVIATPDQLVAHTEEITVALPLAQVLENNVKTSLKDAIHKAGSLPGVKGIYPLGKIDFPRPGARHIVCLTDNSTIFEESLVDDHTSSSYHFRYIVWNYTTPQARPVEYGVGDFLYTRLDSNHTHVVWTYSFRLKPDVFPGSLGGFGRYLFRVTFLDRDYAAMMRASLRPQ